jgi:hypothetical protein
MIVYEEIIVSASSNASVLVVTVSITRIIRKCGTFTNKIVLLWMQMFIAHLIMTK